MRQETKGQGGCCRRGLDPAHTTTARSIPSIPPSFGLSLSPFPPLTSLHQLTCLGGSLCPCWCRQEGCGLPTNSQSSPHSWLSAVATRRMHIPLAAEPSGIGLLAFCHLNGLCEAFLALVIQGRLHERQEARLVCRYTHQQRLHSHRVILAHPLVRLCHPINSKFKLISSRMFQNVMKQKLPGHKCSISKPLLQGCCCFP